MTGETAVGTHAVGFLGDLAFMAEAAVHPAFQRRGIYSAMVARAISEARLSGAEHLVVNCDRNAHSNAGCLKMGFSPIGTRHLFQKS
jgi:predicted N-acetyltransferase YhbS